MSNPWLKKNPFLSIWLSGANSVLGSVRGQAAGQVQRQAKAAMTQATNDMIKAWTAGAWSPPAKAPPRKRARRSR